MTKKFAISVLFLAFSIYAIAQSQPATTEKKKGRPNIPGTFAIDLGFNLPTERENFNTNVFGSRTFNLYYYHDHQFGKSKFSGHAGIGLGMERYKFNNDRTLGYIAGLSTPYDTLRMIPISSKISASSIKKTGLITNYIDIPLELRFSTNPSDPGRSFKVSLGFKFGVLYESFTKIKYRQDGETKKLKDKQNFNLNPFRYGITTRIGAGNFSIYGYYSLTPLFKKGKGPNDGVNPYGEVTNFTIGLTLAAF
jgi:hypothetical protein